jgi:ubiquinone/menaquinone biosynthesis C-methylase UbiE
MTATASSATDHTSHQLARERFGRKKMADKYPSEYRNTWRDRREKACILKCVSLIPRGGRVLDMPCGTGRMTRLLVERGYRLTCGDISEAMLERARENYRIYRSVHRRAPEVPFKACDVLSTGLDDDHFDGISCIRLFHHFDEAETRRQALRELRRICRGPIVVTFLNSFAIDRYTSEIKRWVRGRGKQVSQRPIPFKTFAADIAAAGLKVDLSIAAHWGISSRWFLALSRRESC